MKELIRGAIARIPGLRFWIARKIFLGPGHNTHRFWGVFKNKAAAQAHVPAKLSGGFDEPDLDKFDESVQERDLVLIRILSGFIAETRTLFDFGGNVGRSFYQFRKAMAYPPALRWTVCDVPFVTKLGRKIAAERSETQLFFTDDRRDANGTDVYMTCGALQYLEESFADILRELSQKPPRLLVNRVPLYEGETFFTLQHMGSSVVPYKIANRAQFIADVEALGYRLVEKWENDRFCDIILRPDKFVKHYYGFYFERA